MTWSVLLPVDSGMAPQPPSGFAESNAGGTLEGHCCGRSRSSSVAMIVGCKLFSSSLFFQQCTSYACECMPVGMTRAAMISLEGLMPHHFRLLLSVSL